MFGKPHESRMLVVVLMVGLMILVGCGASEVRLDANANGTQKDLSRGQVLLITLESNPTTGYSWQVVPVDPAILKQVGNAEFKSSAPPPVVGAGGTETFRFETVGAGTTTLKLNYHRPWEKDVPPVITVMLLITVR